MGRMTNTAHSDIRSELSVLNNIARLSVKTLVVLYVFYIWNWHEDEKHAFLLKNSYKQIQVYKAWSIDLRETMAQFYIIWSQILNNE